MRVKSIKDPEYISYIEKLPCMLCGFTPIGVRKLYNEYTDSYKEYPCKNTAHHCDLDMTRTKNDYRVVPLCSHYTVSGRGTRDCHQAVHGNSEYKSLQSKEAFIMVSDEYRGVYLEIQELEEKEII